MLEKIDVEKPKKWKKRGGISIILMISIFLVLFLLTRITIDDVKTVLSAVQPIYIVLGFGIYIGSYIFRTIRFYFLLDKKVRLKDMFTIVCVHNMVNTILPARTGELSYIYLLKKYKIPLEERIATLATARIFDFIIIAFFFLVSVIFLKDLPGIIQNIFWIIAICLVVLVVILCGLLYYSEYFITIIIKLSVKLKINRYQVTNRILKIIENTISSFKIIKSRQIILKSIIFSICIWGAMSLLYFIFLKAFNIDLEFFEIIVIVSFIAFLPLLPFYGVGGFGTMEVAITFFLVAFGVDEAIGIVASFGIHIIGLLYVIVLGLIGSLHLSFKVKKNK